MSRKPRDCYNAWVGEPISGEGPCIWIVAQGSYDRLTPAQAEKLGKKLIEMARYVRKVSK